MAAAPAKLRLVLDYVPCDACLAIPAASPSEQELLCGICRRLDRTAGHKVTVRRAVPVPEPESPLEVVVPPAAAAAAVAEAVPAREPVAETPPAEPEPAPPPAPPLPSVEVVLREAGADVPEPTGDVQVVLAPLEPPAPPAPPVAPAAEAPAAEPEEDVEDLFSFDPVAREDLFEFTAPARPAAPEPAPEPERPAASESFVLEPWPEEGTEAAPAPAKPAATEEDVWAEPVAPESPPPEPAAWPAEPAREEAPKPAEWPAEPAREEAPKPAPWPEEREAAAPAVEEPVEVAEAEAVVEAEPETIEAEPEVAEPVEVEAEPEVAEPVEVEAEVEAEPVEVEPEVAEAEPAEAVEEAVEEVAVEEAESAEAEPAAASPDLPVTALDGVGARYERRLREEGVTTLGELAARDPVELADVTGIPERFLKKWVEDARRRLGQ